MALVRDIIDEQYYEIKGILTLEDILEVSFIFVNHRIQF
jgi:Mg2+/Co2+ transporter CorB